MEFEPMLTPREKSPVPQKILPRGESNPRRCIKQDREPNTLPTELFRPPDPGADMEADDRQVTKVQPSFYHRHSTNRVS